MGLTGGVTGVTGGQCAVSSQPDWGTALDNCAPWGDTAPLRQESQGDSIPKFLPEGPGGVFGAGLCARDSSGCPTWIWDH